MKAVLRAWRGCTRHYHQPLIAAVDNEEKKEGKGGRWRWTAAAAVIGGTAAVVGVVVVASRNVFADHRPPPPPSPSPTFTREEVRKHGRDNNTKWTTFGNVNEHSHYIYYADRGHVQGVYDITDFVVKHPGGEDKILLAAGGSLEPFWALYAQHNTPQVHAILELLRIGNLDPRDVHTTQIDAADPFAADPIRHPALVVNSQKPFNAETPSILLVDSFVTPNPLFFVRNHLPVPQMTDSAKHQLTVEGIGGKTLRMTVEDLKRRFPKVTVTAAIQCAGNRRAEMAKWKNVMGLSWKGTAISNALWTGVRLRDVLEAAGIRATDAHIHHIQFEGADEDPTGNRYGASIPFRKAMNPEVLIAYEMNGEQLPLDHGYPLRVVVPGVVGARQVKWLTTIRASDKESESHWQQKDYRAFSPSVNVGDNVDPSSAPAIQEAPVQSAFCLPQTGSAISADADTVEVAGYAWSGGGRGIIRVEVSTDGGDTWQPTELEQDPLQTLEEMWAWTLWRATIPVPKGQRSVELICKATDRSYNTQPESPKGIWNMRGLLNNCWHRIVLHLKDDDV